MKRDRFFHATRPFATRCSTVYQSAPAALPLGLAGATVAARRRSRGPQLNIRKSVTPTREPGYYPRQSSSLRAAHNDPTLTFSGTWMMQSLAGIRPSLPGLLLSSLVAISASAAARFLGGLVPIPAMVIALLIGIALNPLARRPTFEPGIVLCLKTILRWAVALLGLRIALGEIAALGLTTAILVVVAMAATLAAGFLLARLFALERAYGALAGAGTAVCG